MKKLCIVAFASFFLLACSKQVQEPSVTLDADKAELIAKLTDLSEFPELQGMTDQEQGDYVLGLLDKSVEAMKTAKMLLNNSDTPNKMKEISSLFVMVSVVNFEAIYGNIASDRVLGISEDKLTKDTYILIKAQYQAVIDYYELLDELEKKLEGKKGKKGKASSVSGKSLFSI